MDKNISRGRNFLQKDLEREATIIGVGMGEKKIKCGIEKRENNNGKLETNTNEIQRNKSKLDNLLSISFLACAGFVMGFILGLWNLIQIGWNILIMIVYAIMRVVAFMFFTLDKCIVGIAEFLRTKLVFRKRRKK